MEQHYYKLIEDYTKKSINNEDLADLMLWVELSKENQQTFREVVKTYEAASQYFESPQHQQKSWAKIRQHIKQQPVHETQPLKKARNIRWWSIAAAVILTISSSILYFRLHFHENKSEVTFHEIYNPKGQKRLVTMPDGSNVYLNGDTRIKYAENFDKGKRVVYLEGEAFFDVQHRPKQPFVVHCGKVSTSVLGTSFNINSYKNSAKVMVTVKTGKVGVVYKNGNTRSVSYLLPNEQLSVYSDGSFIKKSNIESEEIDSWRAYKMVFYDQPLSEIMEVIAREYDVDISFQNEAVENTKLTAKFDKCSVIQLMDMVSELTNSKYKINKKKITIY